MASVDATSPAGGASSEGATVVREDSGAAPRAHALAHGCTRSRGHVHAHVHPRVYDVCVPACTCCQASCGAFSTH